MMRFIRFVGAVVVAGLLFAIPAAGQVTDADLDEARAEVQAVRVELNTLAVAHEAALSRSVLLGDQIDALERQMDGSILAIAEYRNQINERAADMYMNGASVVLLSFLGADNASDVTTRTEYLGDLGRQDAALIAAFTIRTTQFESQQVSLQQLEEEQQLVLAELEAVADELNGKLEATSTAYDDLYAQFLVEERQRQIEAERLAREAAEAAARAATSTTVPDPDAPVTATTAVAPTPPPPPPNTSGQVCPIAGVNSFTDTWGAPRSGGRFHQGVDMLAARGTPVVAIEAGSILRMRSGGIGGITVWIRGDSGDEFYYAHMDSWAPGLTVGQRVDPGTLIGAVGNSGNASGGVTHVHWEYHPGGGGAVNPTPLVRSLCG